MPAKTSQTASGYLLGVLEHQRPTPPFLLDRALAVRLPPPPPAATSLHQWLLSGTGVIWTTCQPISQLLIRALSALRLHKCLETLHQVWKKKQTGESTQHLVPFPAGHRDLRNRKTVRWDEQNHTVEVSIHLGCKTHPHRPHSPNSWNATSSMIFLWRQRSTAEVNFEKHCF